MITIYNTDKIKSILSVIIALGKMDKLPGFIEKKKTFGGYKYLESVPQIKPVQ